MLELIMAFFMAMVCPNQTHSSHDCNSNGSGQVTTLDDDGDSGGETGHFPPKPPKP